MTYAPPAYAPPATPHPPTRGLASPARTRERSGAGERLRLSSSHTVVALAGGTGSGKSSLFNKIACADFVVWSWPRNQIWTNVTPK